MPESIVRMRLLVLLVFTALAGIIWLLPGVSYGTNASQYLAVYFLDVGQGDATFLETQGGTQVLIDGGPDSSVLRELGKVMSVHDRTIDMVVATHPDKDHVAGLVDVLARYEVDTILLTENESDSSAAAAFAAAAQAEGADIIYARRGQTFALGASSTLRILFPDTDPSQFESNTASIIAKLQYGEIEFMLTGDAPKSIEEYLVLTDGEHLESEVLKVGHHGSRTSTSELFLAEVNPEFAVISAGKDNRYGHPHVEVTDALFNFGVETFSTAESGTVTFLSDGLEVWVKK